MADQHVKRPSGVLVPADFADPAIGELKPTRTVRPDPNQIATTLDGRDITRGYVTPQILMLPQDQVLRQRGGGDLRLYEDLLRDSQVAATFQQRRGAVVSKEWFVEPGGTRAIDKKAAESLKAQLADLNWDAVTDKMLYGRFYGYSVAELLYGRDGREVVIDRIKVRKARRFRFDGAQRLRLLTFGDLMGELLPERKFWLYTAGTDNDDEPYGLGLGHFLYWPVLFKRNGLRFWLIFLEKFGMPTAKGTYQAGATYEEKQRLLQALSAITTDSGVIIPDGMAIELIEAARSGTADYESLEKRMDDSISKMVVGHTGAADATPGRLGGESMAEEVRSDLVKADADEMCSSFNAGPARWLTDWNYPGAAYPRVWRQTKEPTDWVNMSTAISNLAKAGYRPTRAKMEEMFDTEFEDIKSQGAPGATPPPEPPSDPSAAPAPSFAEHAPEDRLASQLDRRAQPVVDKWVRQIHAIAADATSLPDLSRRLTAAFSELDSKEFAAVMSHALTVANLQGRADASDEAE